MSSAKQNLVRNRLKSSVYPALEERGFIREFARRQLLWRQHDDAVDVIEFDIIPPGRSADWRVPAYSLLVNAGVHYKFMPCLYDDELQHRDSAIFPDVAACHFRLDLDRAMRQPQCRIKNVWCIDDDGKDLDEILQHLNTQLALAVLSWFELFRHPERIYTDLMQSKAQNDGYRQFCQTYQLAFGISLEIPGLLAHHLGDHARAPALLDETLASDFFDEQYERIQYLKQELERIRGQYAD